MQPSTTPAVPHQPFLRLEETDSLKGEEQHDGLAAGLNGAMNGVLQEHEVDDLQRWWKRWWSMQRGLHQQPAWRGMPRKHQQSDAREPHLEGKGCPRNSPAAKT